MVLTKEYQKWNPSVVTGENNSPTAANAGSKRRQNGYPMSGGATGPPCPVGYKYSGLALQVGGLGAGWQPVTIEKLNIVTTCHHRKANYGDNLSP
jgi:hypothetical protein